MATPEPRVKHPLQKRQSYTLTLVPTPACADPIRALRWILKGALRAHHMRCTDIRETETTEGGGSDE
jgi:hypothetical protein